MSSNIFKNATIPSVLLAKPKPLSKPDIIIMRGLPGSGKSSFVKIITERNRTGKQVAVVSADNFFIRDGVYSFDQLLLPDAHDECFYQFKEYIEHYSNELGAIIVDNTNTTLREIHRYTNVAEKYGLQYYIIEILPLISVNEGTEVDLPMALAQSTIHEVPAQSISRMVSKWEEFNNPRDLSRCSGKIRLMRRIKYVDESINE